MCVSQIIGMAAQKAFQGIIIHISHPTIPHSNLNTIWGPCYTNFRYLECLNWTSILQIKVMGKQKIFTVLHPKKSCSSLNVVPATFFLVWLACPTESTYEVRKNIFYFTSKALFVLEVFKCHDVIKCLNMKQETFFIEQFEK